LQPADVEDLGEAVARVMQRAGKEPLTVECGGPRVYSHDKRLKRKTVDALQRNDCR
jgi:NADH dehydrogenase